MLIKEIDFRTISQYKNTNVIPVFMQYGEECYEIVNNRNQTETAWSIFQKIFYNKLYISKKDYLDQLLDAKLFANDKSSGLYIFSRSDKTFHNELATKKDRAIKFAKNAYIGVREKLYEYLVILKKVVTETSLNDFKLFVSTVEEVNSDDYKKEYEAIKKRFTRKKKNPYKIKRGNLVVGHINALVLNDEEKLIKYVIREFNRKCLLGDIILDDSQEKLLNNYMRRQLNKFINSSVKDKKLDFKPEYSRLFAFGLVRYAMKYYNKRHSGDFWPHFKDEFDVEIGVNRQQFLHDEFKKLMNCYDKIYEDSVTNKIDNITMHSFVADNSAFQLFDFLFDFWRLDLSRNSDNLSIAGEGEKAFGTLIDAMSQGTQDVMSHTSLLLHFPKSKVVCKSRVKRILRLINDAFWNGRAVNETGNRINHLLNQWIAEPKGAFQKEKNYVATHSSKTKGEVMFHSPVFEVTPDYDTLKIVLPHQRLIGCGDEDYPVWKISCSNPNVDSKELKPVYKHDKIGYYVERTNVNIPFSSMLSEFKFALVSGEKILKKYKIEESNIRFFDCKGKCIDYRTANIPVGFVTAFSNNKEYPYVVAENNEESNHNGLVMKDFNLEKGQVIVLDDGTGLQVGQKLVEGLNETYPISGAYIKSNDVQYQIYSRLPKLLFKSTPDQIGGISLVINGTQNRINDKKINEFKLADDLKANGYLIDLHDYISREGLYTLSLSYPKMHVPKSLGYIAYIKNFNYEFKEAPYIFKEYGTIVFKSELKIDKNKSDDEGVWNIGQTYSEFTFNFGERNQNSENFCKLINGGKLKLEYTLNGMNYPIYFDIPALYWKFNKADEWNTKPIANVLLKDLNNKVGKLYISGPFNLTKSIITTTNDVEISDEESEIKFQSGNGQFFDISKIYNWFRNDRTEVFRSVSISLDEKCYPLFNVVCKSRLVDISLIGDFDNNLLKGEVNIEGNESYTVSIYHKGLVICEDEQIVDNQFCIEGKLESGDYEVNVYEVLEDYDDDGFDIESESILLNPQPIIKRIINIKDLTGQVIKLNGYQDIYKRFYPRVFNKNYYLMGLEKTTYYDFLDEHKETEIYGIWQDYVNVNDPNDMNRYTYYKAKLYVEKYSGGYKFLMNVLILFTDITKLESIIILAKDGGSDDYGSLCIEKDRMWIIPAFQFENMTKLEKKKCDCFNDNQDFYLIEIEEG